MESMLSPCCRTGVVGEAGRLFSGDVGLHPFEKFRPEQDRNASTEIGDGGVGRQIIRIQIQDTLGTSLDAELFHLFLRDRHRRPV